MAGAWSSPPTSRHVLTSNWRHVSVGSKWPRWAHLQSMPSCSECDHNRHRDDHALVDGPLGWSEKSLLWRSMSFQPDEQSASSKDLYPNQYIFQQGNCAPPVHSSHLCVFICALSRGLAGVCTPCMSDSRLAFKLYSNKAGCCVFLHLMSVNMHVTGVTFSSSLQEFDSWSVFCL